MSTDKQNDANRANSLLSTGPASLEGKNHVRRNALKSGLSSRSLILPENEAKLAEKRKKSFAASFNLDQPDGFSEVLIAQIAVESVRIERCQQEEQLIREHASEESAALWHLERRIAACELGKTLHDDPEVVRFRLETTYQGVEWLRGRWLILNMALETKGGWNEVETALSLDLAGTPAMLRETMTLGTLEERKALVASELDRLKKEGFERSPLEFKWKDLAEVGVSVELDKRLKTLRRYETASRRAFDKSLAELRRHIGEIKSNVKASIELDQTSKPDTVDYETNPISMQMLKRLESEIEAELAILRADREIKLEPEPIAPVPIRLSERPAGQPNRKQRRKLALVKRSA